MRLVGVLVDCVEGGASVSFMHPLTPKRAQPFWTRISRAVEPVDRMLLVAEDEHVVLGTVQLVLDMPENAMRPPAIM